MTLDPARHAADMSVVLWTLLKERYLCALLTAEMNRAKICVDKLLVLFSALTFLANNSKCTICCCEWIGLANLNEWMEICERKFSRLTQNWPSFDIINTWRKQINNKIKKKKEGRAKMCDKVYVNAWEKNTTWQVSLASVSYISSLFVPSRSTAHMTISSMTISHNCAPSVGESFLKFARGVAGEIIPSVPSSEERHAISPIL